MEVVALEMGFKFGRRIRAGERFDVDEGEAAPWFAPVDTEAARAARAQAGHRDVAAPVTLSELGREGAAVSGLDHAKRVKGSSVGAARTKATKVSDIA